MVTSDESRSLARQAVSRILAGIKVTITDDISEFSEVIAALDEARANGGAYAAQRVYMTLKNSTAWLREIDAPEDIYPHIYDPEQITQDDLKALYAYEDSDFGQAEAIIYLYKDRLRYVVGLEWLLWNGMRWIWDDREAVMQYGMVAARIRLKAANYAQELAESKEAREAALFRQRAASSRRNVGPIRRALEAAATMQYFVTDAQELDRDNFKLGVRNGVIDLKTGELIAPHPDHLITKRADVTYYPDAPCPRWEKFLKEVFQGDQDLIEYIQRCIGYSLTGDTREQCFFVLHGIGANGKGTFGEIIKAITGEYASAIEFKTLMAGEGSKVGDDLAPLRGMRLIVASESEQGKRLNEALVKQVTGGDPVRVRHLFGRYFTFYPAFKIWLMTNHKPIITGTDRGIWRRVRMIPFNARFEGKDADKVLPQYLQAELSGILAWAVRGCQRWQQVGLDMPEAVQKATEDYRTEMDTLGMFLSEATVDGAQYKVTVKSLYASYKEHTSESGLYTMSQPAFGRALIERGYEQARSNGVYWWKGIGLLAKD